MTKNTAHLFSPFSPDLVKEDHYRVLLLQLFLKELLATHQALMHHNPVHLIISTPSFHFPYDWAKESGHLNKVQEHARLLHIAFSDLEEQTQQIQKILNRLILQFSNEERLTPRQNQYLQKKIHHLYSLTEPLIAHFKDNENLIFFLLNSQSFLNALMGKGYLHALLSSLHEKGLQKLEKQLCDRYHQRGFFSLIPQLKTLFLGLTHH